MGIEFANPTDDTRRNGVGQSFRAADDDHFRTDFRRLRITEGDDWQVKSPDPDDRNIFQLVDTDHFSCEIDVAIGKPDAQRDRAAQHVEAGHDPPMWSNDKAAALTDESSPAIESLDNHHRPCLTAHDLTNGPNLLVGDDGPHRLCHHHHGESKS